MKFKTITLLTLSACTGASSAALTAINLSFETGGQPPAGWSIQASTGSQAISGEDFRTAGDPDNWYPDSTAGNTVQLLEMDNANESGYYGQQLTGVAEAGTYTWSLADVGVTNFAANAGAILSYGFSLDGTSFIGGSSTTLVEGVDIFSPNNNATGQYNGSVSYTATGAETNLYILFERPAGHTGRSTVAVGSTTLDFVAAPEPSSTALLGLGGLALILRRRK